MANKRLVYKMHKSNIYFLLVFVLLLNCFQISVVRANDGTELDCSDFVGGDMPNASSPEYYKWMMCPSILALILEIEPDINAANDFLPQAESTVMGAENLLASIDAEIENEMEQFALDDKTKELIKTLEKLHDERVGVLIAKGKMEELQVKLRINADKVKGPSKQEKDALNIILGLIKGNDEAIRKLTEQDKALEKKIKELYDKIQSLGKSSAAEAKPTQAPTTPIQPITNPSTPQSPTQPTVTNPSASQSTLDDTTESPVITTAPEEPVTQTTSSYKSVEDITLASKSLAASRNAKVIELGSFIRKIVRQEASTLGTEDTTVSFKLNKKVYLTKADIVNFTEIFKTVLATSGDATTIEIELDRSSNKQFDLTISDDSSGSMEQSLITGKVQN